MPKRKWLDPFLESLLRGLNLETCACLPQTFLSHIRVIIVVSVIQTTDTGKQFKFRSEPRLQLLRCWQEMFEVGDIAPTWTCDLERCLFKSHSTHTRVCVCTCGLNWCHLEEYNCEQMFVWESAGAVSTAYRMFILRNLETAISPIVINGLSEIYTVRTVVAR